MYYITFDNYKPIDFTIEEWNNLPLEKISEIYFACHNYTKNNLSILPNLDKLINLKILCCMNNLLTELPNLDKLINLEKLQCVSNNLEKLPNLDNLIKLEELYCSNNNLKELPNLDNLVNLKQLQCNYNKLTKMPNLDKVINLNLLSCSNNILTELPNLNNLVNLKHLIINNNKIITFTEDIITKPSLKINFSYKELGKYYKINNYKYNELLPYLINSKIKHYYYLPVINLLNDIYINKIYSYKLNFNHPIKEILYSN